MTQRKIVAGGILILWVGALGLLAQRELMPNEEKRRQAAAMLIEPGSFYYAVERGGDVLGYASSQIDTSLLGVHIRSQIITERLDGPDSNRTPFQFEAFLSPQLRLRNYDISSGRSPNQRQLIARNVADTALEMRSAHLRRPRLDTVPFSQHAVTPELAPLLLAVGRALRAGDVHEVEIFDRSSRTVSRAAIRIEAESVFVVADSARWDAASGLWAAARMDTVPAWRATIPGEGGGTVWFDRGGRVVLQDIGGGITLRRTAFELSFENWRSARNLAAERGLDGAVEPPPPRPLGTTDRGG